MKEGQIFADRYRIIREIGRGGMGSIYQAQDLKLNETVALKLLLPNLQQSSEIIQRFIREIKLALRITHENVIRIYDIGEQGQIHYISMEYIEGIDLKEMITQRGAFSTDVALTIFKQICAGLATAHRREIIHRDMKPQNILITEDNLVKIVDFGIAKVQADASKTAGGMTKEGMVIGTPEYMSPEQALARKLDHRTDIYSLGAIMYESMTGEQPFTGRTAMDILIMQVKEPPKAPTQINPAIPRELEAIILKALEKDPDARFQTVDEMLAELVKFEATLLSPHVLEVLDVYDDSAGTQLGTLEVIEELEELTEMTPLEEKQDNVDSIFQKGMNLFSQREFSRALKFFEQVVKLDPHHPQAYNYVEIAGAQISREATISRLMAECERALHKKDLARAQKLVEDAAKIGPDNPQVQIAIKRVKTAIEKTGPLPAMPDQTTQNADTTTGSPAVAAGATFDAGKKFYEEKKYDKALEIFQELFDKNPQHPKLIDYLELSKAAKATKEETEHHFLTARRLIEEGDSKAARQELMITLDYDSEHEEARKLLEKIEGKPHDPSQPAGSPTAESIARQTGKDPDLIKALQSAQETLREKDFDEAVAILERTSKKYPDNSDEINGYIDKIRKEQKRFLVTTFLKRGQLFMREEKYHQAISAFNKVLEQDADNPTANDYIKQSREKLADERAHQDNVTKATVRDRENVFDGEFQGRRTIGKGIIVLGVLVVALLVAGLTQTTRIKAKIGEFFRGRGMVQFNNGDYEAAAGSLQRAHDLIGDDQILISLGEAYYRNGSYGQAQSIFTQLSKDDNNKAQYHFFLGLIADKQKNGKKAKEELNKAIKLDKNYYSPLNALGDISLQEKNTGQAIQYFSRSLSIKDSQPNIQLQLAHLYQDSGQAESALAVYSKIIRSNPSFAEAYTEAGNLNIKLGRYQSAINVFSRHPHFASGDAALYYSLGDVYEKLAKTREGGGWRDAMKEAENYFRKCIIIETSYKDVMIRLSGVLRSMRDYDSLISTLEQYLHEFPKDVTVRLELGELYEIRKRYAGAFEQYGKATDIEPTNKEAWNKLGKLHMARGNKRDARIAFSRSLDIDKSQSSIRRDYNSLK